MGIGIGPCPNLAIDPGNSLEEAGAAATDGALRLVSTRLPMGGERTVYTSMNPDELVRAMIDSQSMDLLALAVRRVLATPESNRSLTGVVDLAMDQPSQESTLEPQAPPCVSGQQPTRRRSRRLLEASQCDMETPHSVEDQILAGCRTSSTPRQVTVKWSKWKLEDNLLYFRNRVCLPMIYGLRWVITST